ncbi:MAG: LamG-like jellyroll fold domain-containing protein [bacterium]
MIVNPSASTTSNIVTIAQDTPRTFSWTINDVAADLASMSVTWDFGDGTTTNRTGGSGSVIHTYTAIGDKTVIITAVDKDGGRAERQFMIRVAATKAVNVTPIGPNMEANYWGAAGIGNGMVNSPEALSRVNRNNVYFFRYDPGVTSATLEAVPYKTAPLGYYNVVNYNSAGVGVVSPVRNEYDSFFYVWVGTDQGIAEQNLNPAQAGSSIIVTLPAAQTGGANGAPTSVETRDIQAIFSREYRIADNMGDINLDGIPDKIATRYNLPAIAGGAGAVGGTPADLTNVGNYNGDNDFLPGAASGGGAIIGGISNVFATIGDPFTAFLEVRGFHPGLNNAQYGSDDDFGPGESQGDEPRVGDRQGTDPTLLDTDGDLFPDGWEYYFWYNARMKLMTGSRYNPLDVAQGTVIPYKDIVVAFDPLVPATDSETGAAVNRDLDNDGLSDIEELSMGTNPINWDTDGDGMCDGWEVLRGLNPNDSRDGLSFLMNNLDGDHMAFATVPRQMVTAVAGLKTNTYLAVSTTVGATNGTFTTWYHYGDTNAPIAVGRVRALEGGEIVVAVAPTTALILHYQVYQEFGFDPRTAWQSAPNRPNTRPFTTVDEYLLLKFMAEVQRNGAATEAQRMTNPTTQMWSDFSTHPLTPDTDSEGMPDGWELYVACGPVGAGMVINPWEPLDANWNPMPVPPFDDGIVNRSEFAGFDSVAVYAAAALYGAGDPTVTITRPDADLYWTNKLWPTDPWNGDTDGDGLSDSAEVAFTYGNAAAPGAGGGLNPCSMDTDGDRLTDTWEAAFAGTPVAAAGAVLPPVIPGTPAIPVAMVISNGMDGTVGDALQDWDHDGLRNYQEYLVQSIRNFRYDRPDEGLVSLITGAEGLPMNDTFQPYTLFNLVTNVWDPAFTLAGTYLLLPVNGVAYVSTDPTDPDSDKDGMDDYYEMFHGLNPILGDDRYPGLLGDRIAIAYPGPFGPLITAFYNDWNPDPFIPLDMDFITYPWLDGLPEADPDADGLLNLEEKLLPNTAAPAYSNTDPSPIWLTDESSVESLTYRFYWTQVWYWGNPPPAYLYSFEMNEGYDTDNDGVSDKAEMLQTATTKSDPQDHDDPRRRQAIWFSGADSAAQTVSAYSYGAWAFRSFTVELWARPEITGREQVLIERPIAYAPSDLSNLTGAVRKNFRIGIAADGRVYAMFQNAGVHDEHTGMVQAYGRILPTNQWVHLAARMDGAAGQFQLLVNGFVETTVPTTLIPANGVINTLLLPNEPEPDYVALNAGTLVLGAADIVGGGATWFDYDLFFQGFVDEVRVWDGARSNDEIRTDYTKRYTKTDVLANQRTVLEGEAAGASRVVGTPLPLAAELIYHYTFDNLFSADRVASVAKVPRGFNSAQVSVNRPAGSMVGWWSEQLTHSMVYNDYGYIPWIENTVGHLPLSGYVMLGTNSVLFNAVSVRNSLYYTYDYTGDVATTNLFPNSNDPYGYVYVTRRGIFVASDLLPMGGAWAKQTTDLWDNGGPSGNWAETGNDSDSDGLPDWWESYRGLNPLSGEGDNGWYGLFPDGSGMTNGERFMRDLANGYTETNNPGNPSGWNPSTLLKQTSDIDGDGLPDWWENIFNLDPADPTGLNGATGDADLDGLSNYAEYLISELYGFRLSRPTKFRTSASQVESDYFQKPATNSLVYLGELFADHDFMEDGWEDQFDPYYISRFVYDPQIDNDQDGWSNWSECRYGSDPSLGSTNDFPVPVMQFNLSYNGFRAVGFPVTVLAYSSPDMNGAPDSIYTTLPVMAWPRTETFLRPTSGHIKEGTAYFFAMVDLNNNATWDAGEPCGVSDGFGVGIGWDRNVVDIDLTDYAPNYLRMTLNPPVRTEDVLFGGGAAGGGGGGAAVGIETRMRVQRKYINTYPALSQRYVLDKTFLGVRNFIHEGDFLEQGTPGLDWGFPGDTAANVLSVIYQVYQNSEAVTAVLTFTNTFDSVRAKAVSTYPVNGTYVYSSRPVFKWSMPAAYTAFTLELRKGSSAGTVVYSSGTVMAPVRDADGNCVWTAPIHAGDRIPSTGQIFSSNTAYAWRVIAMNPKFCDTTTGAVWSDWKLFRLDVNQPLDSSGYGAVQVRVKYYGPATNLLSNRVKVQAFNNRGFAGVPEAEYTLTASEQAAMVSSAATNITVVLRGLTPSRFVGDYSIRAFIDSNQNSLRDVWESWGYVNHYGVTDTPYDVHAVTVEYVPQTLVYDIRIEDADSDQDWYPDAWEYQLNPSGDFLNLTGPSSAANPDTEVNPFLSLTSSLGRTGLSLFSAALVLTTSDADSDGLGDMVELVLGSNASAASTAGDGFTDGAKLSLGLSPFDRMTFNVTGLSLSDDAATVQWKLNVLRAANVNRSLWSITGTVAARYEIQYKASLSDPAWLTVEHGTVTLDGVEPDKSTEVGTSQLDAVQGFFRVQLKKAE